MRDVLRILILAWGAGLAFSTSAGIATAQPAAGKLQPVRFVEPAITAYFWDVYVAQHKGLFEKHGIRFERSLAAAAPATLAALLGGSADIGTPAMDAVITAIEKGGALAIIGGQANRVIYTIVGRRDITSLQQLRGKRLATASVGDGSTFQLKKFLAHHGLRPGDYETIISGAVGARLAALRSGAVAATILAQPADLQALKEGFTDLGRISEPFLFVAHLATRKFLAEKPDAAVNYVRAIIDATDWLLNPANKDEAVQILVKETKVDRDIAAATYDLYIREGVFPKGAAINREALGAVLDALIEAGKLPRPRPPLEKYIDEGPLKKAQAR
jgi:ABC-type nitrate/sulfonate/bicarbonate transport system substrate-binding protein